MENTGSTRPVFQFQDAFWGSLTPVEVETATAFESNPCTLDPPNGRELELGPVPLDAIW